MLPLVGLNSPNIISIKVLLPDPLSPTKPTRVPNGMFMFILSRVFLEVPS